jgi:inner membrane protein
LAAKESYLGQVYLDWAQYAITETEPLSSPERYSVRFYDLRYLYPGRTRSPLSAGVILDRELKVVAEFFGQHVRQPAEKQ